MRAGPRRNKERNLKCGFSPTLPVLMFGLIFAFPLSFQLFGGGVWKIRIDIFAATFLHTVTVTVIWPLQDPAANAVKGRIGSLRYNMTLARQGVPSHPSILVTSMKRKAPEKQKHQNNSNHPTTSDNLDFQDFSLTSLIKQHKSRSLPSFVEILEL